MEACEIFFPQKKLGRRVLGMEACEIFSHKKIREKVLGMEACEVFFPQKK